MENCIKLRTATMSQRYIIYSTIYYNWILKWSKKSVRNIECSFEQRTLELKKNVRFDFTWNYISYNPTISHPESSIGLPHVYKKYCALSSARHSGVVFGTGFTPFHLVVDKGFPNRMNWQIYCVNLTSHTGHPSNIVFIRPARWALHPAQEG